MPHSRSPSNPIASRALSGSSANAGSDAVRREGPMVLLVLLRILVVVVIGGLIFGLRRYMTRP